MRVCDLCDDRSEAVTRLSLSRDDRHIDLCQKHETMFYSFLFGGDENGKWVYRRNKDAKAA